VIIVDDPVSLDGQVLFHPEIIQVFFSKDCLSIGPDFLEVEACCCRGNSLCGQENY